MPPTTRPVSVVVVSPSAATRDPLLEYFREAGVTAHGRGGAKDIARACRSASAVVVFPDELEHPVVVAQLEAARAARPGVLVLLVTGAPKRFAACVAKVAKGESAPVRVIAKPVFGWTLLDAIRAHVAESDEAGR